MGLSLQVGIIADLAGADPEGAEWARAGFRAVNALLESAGLPPHVEPEACSAWSEDMPGYSGLHALRRVAAHLDAGAGLPLPSGDDGSRDAQDPVLEAYTLSFVGRTPGLLARLFSRPPAFERAYDHLIVHGDAEGYYLPQDFVPVLIGDDETIPGGMVGSAPRLLAELDRLAQALDIPADIEVGSDELRAAAEGDGAGAATWQRYGVEAYSCVVLREGCRACLATGAALVFC